MSKLNNEPKVQFSQETRDAGYKCEQCRLSAPNMRVSYSFNPFSTQMTSDTGWWIRVDHHWELGYHGVRREKFDTVAAVFCPECREKHHNDMAKFLKEVL